MQLLRLAIYNFDGRQKPIDFKPGSLNIVTGFSKTGKSALLDIVDFCLGRDDAPIPRTKAFRPVAWYGTLWELADGTRAFLGRPTIKPGRSSTTQAMLLLGGKELDLPAYTELFPNTDSDSLRDQIGARLGIGGARLNPPEGSTRSPYKVGLGQAAIFLFQTQGEVANKSLLFHRQDESRMKESIKDSLPFFLGVVKGDHAEKHQQLRAARRQLRRAEVALEAAEVEASEYDTQIQSLLAEAFASGLADIDRAPTTELALEVLQGILRTVPSEPLPTLDLETQDRHRALRAERNHLRAELGQFLDERGMLLESTATEGSYEGAIAQQLQRLRSVELLPSKADSSSHVCPVCNQHLADEDPTPIQLQARLVDLASELEVLAAVQPGRDKALTAVSGQIHATRERLTAVESAIAATELAQAADAAPLDPKRQQFVRGRIDATVGRLALRRGTDIRALHEAVHTAKQRVESLERELDDDAARERLTSALISLGREMTRLAQELNLENSEESVRLDLAKLTVVTDTADGPVQLSGLGSGANWLGYHLATHLALHRTFLNQGAPVPRLLMLDQPTQVFYESKSKAVRAAIEETGVPADEDHASVTRMFRLLFDFVQDLAPHFQIVVSDHADLTEEGWFQDSIAYNWRGDALVPADWIE
ncbi:DUF3732 domain-containing protein [Agromyces sp. NPDC058136]|uniref:DUF3732 domain-containing protein n=1 Tax=Agromyces sp. NPDC058136 TaxID=3346354 RepID=UPI0036D9EE31